MLGEVGGESGASEARAHAGAPTTRANRFVGIGAPGVDPQPGGLEQRGDALAVVLGADLGAERLAVREGDVADPGDVHGLGAHRDEMHLDPVRHRVVEGAVLERLGIEVGPELVVQHPQHVAVELGGDAPAVVVGRLDARDVLPEIGAHEEPVARLHRRPHPPEQPDGRGRIEVADGAAEEGEQRRPRQAARQVQLLGDVGDGGLDLRGRDIPGAAGRPSGSGRWR